MNVLTPTVTACFPTSCFKVEGNTRFAWVKSWCQVKNGNTRLEYTSIHLNLNLDKLPVSNVFLHKDSYYQPAFSSVCLQPGQLKQSNQTNDWHWLIIIIVHNSTEQQWTTLFSYLFSPVFNNIERCTWCEFDFLVLDLASLSSQCRNLSPLSLDSCIQADLHGFRSSLISWLADALNEAWTTLASWWMSRMHWTKSSVRWMHLNCIFTCTYYIILNPATGCPTLLITRNIWKQIMQVENCSARKSVRKAVSDHQRRCKQTHWESHPQRSRRCLRPGLQKENTYSDISNDVTKTSKTDKDIRYSHEVKYNDVTTCYQDVSTVLQCHIEKQFKNMK